MDIYKEIPKKLAKFSFCETVFFSAGGQPCCWALLSRGNKPWSSQGGGGGADDAPDDCDGVVNAVDE